MYFVKHTNFRVLCVFVLEMDIFYLIRIIVVRFHIGWGGEQSILYKGVETFPQKKTISPSGGLGLLP